MSEQSRALRRRPGEGLYEQLTRLARRLGGWRTLTLAAAYIAGYVLLANFFYCFLALFYLTFVLRHRVLELSFYANLLIGPTSQSKIMIPPHADSPRLRQ